MARAEGFLLFVEEDGLLGVGDAAPTPSHGTEDAASCRAALAAWARGERPLNGLPPAARAAAATATMDLRARAEGIPLARLLSPSPAADVAVAALLPDGDARVAAEAAAREGHRAVKAKAPRAAGAAALAAALREAVGPGVAVRLDANGAWSGEDAAAAGPALAAAGVEFVEQPTRALPAASPLRAHVRVAADESAASVEGAHAVLAAGAADLLVLKAATLGGPDRLVAVAGAARAQGVDVVVSTVWESAVGRTAALHAAAALGAGPLAHGLGAGRLLARDVADAPPIVGGRMAAPRGPGLGIDVRPGPEAARLA